MEPEDRPALFLQRRKWMIPAIALVGVISLQGVVGVPHGEVFKGQTTGMMALKQRTSIGQLVRYSQAIAYVVVGDQLVNDSGDDLGVELQIERKLLGDPPPAVYIRRNEILYPGHLPSRGDRGVAFMAREGVHLPPPAFDWGSMSTVDDQTVAEGGTWYILGGPRGFLIGDQEVMQHFERAIHGFARWYRARDSSPLEHAQFITALWESPVIRLKEDSRFDYMSFRRVLSAEEQDELMAMDDFPDSMRRTILDMRARAAASIEAGRLAMIEAEKSKVIRTREEVEGDFEQANWREAVQSADRQQLVRAFRFLDSMRYDERETHADLWAPALRGLLAHDDFPVRAMAARHLSMIGDRSAVPVLLDLLRSGQRGAKSAADMLRQISGEQYPFDPDAPPEEKDEQIRVWEEWWERESADLP